MKKVIIEARVNEYAMRDVNSNVPWTVEELVEEAQRVREAGASIMHFTPGQMMGNQIIMQRSMQKLSRK